MKHLELHILQSFPVACLNRDDLNSPKTAVFGGVQRARVSSQCWKRAIRELASETLLCMKGQRTRLVVGALANELDQSGLKSEVIPTLAQMAASQLSKIDSKKDHQGFFKVTTLCFLSDQEISSIARAISENEAMKQASEDLALAMSSSEPDEKKREKQLEQARKACEKLITKDAVGKALKSVHLKDAADIALFGRMVANDHSLTVEGAAMFGHALSTHKAENEIDFFSAVDDLQPEKEAGAGMTGTLEFNSATYYRFAALNLDMLKDSDHLGVLSKEERKDVVRSFLKATMMAVPGARKTSMNAATLPGYVLGIVRKQGHPVQLVNAFESPIRWNGRDSLLELSIAALKGEYDRINATWDLKADELACPSIPENPMAQFLDEVTRHVD